MRVEGWSVGRLYGYCFHRIFISSLFQMKLLCTWKFSHCVRSTDDRCDSWRRLVCFNFLLICLESSRTSAINEGWKLTCQLVYWKRFESGENLMNFSQNYQSFKTIIINISSLMDLWWIIDHVNGDIWSRQCDGNKFHVHNYRPSTDFSMFSCTHRMLHIIFYI